MNLEGLQVLIVEDEFLVASAVNKMLERQGCQCRVEASGAAAVNAVNERRPDIILMDIGLPGEMDGIDTAHSVWQNTSIPVVFISGYSDLVGNQRVVDSAHPYTFLVKPVTERDILGAIKQIAVNK